jgi:hypothetical protein
MMTQALNRRSRRKWIRPLNGAHRIKRAFPSCSYLVVDNVLQTDSLGIVEIVEELLVEDEGNSTDLLQRTFRLRVPVDKVGRDGNGQLAAKLFAAKALQRVAFAVGANQHVKLKVGHRVVIGGDAGAPANLKALKTMR